MNLSNQHRVLPPLGSDNGTTMSAFSKLDSEHTPLKCSPTPRFVSLSKLVWKIFLTMHCSSKCIPHVSLLTNHYLNSFFGKVLPPLLLDEDVHYHVLRKASLLQMRKRYHFIFYFWAFFYFLLYAILYVLHNPPPKASN